MLKRSLSPEQLARIRSFSKFSDKELEEFLQFAELTHCPKGAIIFHEGSPGDCMYLIADGQLFNIL